VKVMRMPSSFKMKLTQPPLGNANGL
jgi:hypothetical protein